MVLYRVALQVGKKFAKTPTEDKDYVLGKNMLQKLDLQKYEKNLRKGMLTDSTLHLVNDRFITVTRNLYLFLVHCRNHNVCRYLHEEHSFCHIECVSSKMS